MKILDFIRTTSLRISQEREILCFHEYAISELEFYISQLKEIDEDDLKRVLSTEAYSNMSPLRFINMMKEIVKIYTNVLDSVYRGNIYNAFYQLKSLLFCDKVKHYKLKDLYINYFKLDFDEYMNTKTLYRVCDFSQEFVPDSCNHLPFECRSISAFNRFNMTGYPCLYLADSIKTCEKEMGKRKKGKIRYYSEFTPKKSLILLDLTIPDPLSIASFNNNKTFSYLLTYPLILLTLTKVKTPNNYKNKKNAFFEEYLISQLLFHLLFFPKDSSVYYDGISYTSTKDYKGKSFVIPAKMGNQIQYSGYSDYINNLFDISKSIKL